MDEESDKDMLVNMTSLGSNLNQKRYYRPDVSVDGQSFNIKLAFAAILIVMGGV